VSSHQRKYAVWAQRRGASRPAWPRSSPTPLSHPHTHIHTHTHTRSFTLIHTHAHTHTHTHTHSLTLTLTHSQPGCDGAVIRGLRGCAPRRPRPAPAGNSQRHRRHDRTGPSASSPCVSCFAPLCSLFFTVKGDPAPPPPEILAGAPPQIELVPRALPVTTFGTYPQAPLPQGIGFLPLPLRTFTCGCGRKPPRPTSALDTQRRRAPTRTGLWAPFPSCRLTIVLLLFANRQMRPHPSLSPAPLPRKSWSVPSPPPPHRI